MFAYSPGPSHQPSAVLDAARIEELRQQQELVLIPSESICFPEAAEVVSSSFGNLYAEGQPHLRLSRVPQELARDPALFAAWYARLSDGRFYRGCREADRVELLAKGNIAEAFARLKGSPAKETIHVNVQGLSGAAANLSVYEALLKDGETLMGLDLCHGGHLSHGSPFNVSGRRFKVVSYGIDEKAAGDARKLDYNRIRELAKQHLPKILIGGGSAYPWDFDWAALRSIADECGALLMADIAHLAGMIVGGVLNNPLPHVDIVTFTTHKTLCGPRGAAILTTCAERAKKIDNAVFPGLQGGPHVNSIAGIARLFEIINAQTEGFATLQRRIVDNSKVLADALVAEGFALEYGGTNIHLCLVDLKAKSGPGGGKLDGETASRLLENAGIICNKNTLPGDGNSSKASGLRFGTPWLTQRGIPPGQLKELAKAIASLLKATHPFRIYVPSGDERCRARVAFPALQHARQVAAGIAASLPYPPTESTSSASATQALPLPIGDRFALSVRGEKARLMLEQALSCDVLSLKVDQMVQGYVLRPDGSVLDDVGVMFLGSNPNPALAPNVEEVFGVFPHAKCVEETREWLQALSDGYVLLDANDPYIKVEGPVAIEVRPVAALTDAQRGQLQKLSTPQGPLDPRLIERKKVFFVGQNALPKLPSAAPKTQFVPADYTGALRKTVLHGWHAAAGAKMAPFANWEMPIEYPGSGIFAEHAAVRAHAGIFDVSHMTVLEFSGPQAMAFLDAVLANSASRLAPGEAQYSYLLGPDGIAFDDVYAYRLEIEKFLVVVNAGNTERDLAWLRALNAGEALPMPDYPERRVPGPVTIRNLRDAGEDSRLDLAFQGPATLPLLIELAGSDAERARLRRSKLNDIFALNVGGIPVLSCRTGYTGEELGFELLVHPDRTQELWELLLSKGKSRGVLACGLGARDSLRVEAGFPLFGHELEGSEKLSLTEADYGFVPRVHVPFYVGRSAYLKRVSPRPKRLLRLKGQGRRSVRGGQAILDAQGKPVGVVTSFAFSDPSFNFNVLAAVNAKFNPPVGSAVRAYRTAPDQVTGVLDEGKLVDLTVAPRFPTPEEKASWAKLYKGE